MRWFDDFLFMAIGIITGRKNRTIFVFFYFITVRLKDAVVGSNGILPVLSWEIRCDIGSLTTSNSWGLLVVCVEGIITEIPTNTPLSNGTLDFEQAA